MISFLLLVFFLYSNGRHECVIVDIDAIPAYTNSSLIDKDPLDESTKLSIDLYYVYMLTSLVLCLQARFGMFSFKTLV